MIKKGGQLISPVQRTMKELESYRKKTKGGADKEEEFNRT
jgi:hypothetical protein